FSFNPNHTPYQPQPIHSALFFLVGDLPAPTHQHQDLAIAFRFRFMCTVRHLQTRALLKQLPSFVARGRQGDKYRVSVALKEINGLNGSRGPPPVIS
ncbi:hypothetical protein M8C21_018885, partial [Ambrosia artemisiifolia]